MNIDQNPDLDLGQSCLWSAEILVMWSCVLYRLV